MSNGGRGRGACFVAEMAAMASVPQMALVSARGEKLTVDSLWLVEKFSDRWEMIRKRNANTRILRIVRNVVHDRWIIGKNGGNCANHAATMDYEFRVS
jgi:hypothetical protein